MLLLQFPYSHFCEKARWALDYKHQPYITKNLVPLLHLFTTRRVAPTGQVPILLHAGEVIQGSDQIIDWLDVRVPDRPLTPAAPDAARTAREWEHFAGQEIGVHLRRWFYGHTLADRQRALGFLHQGASPWQKATLSLGFPLIRAAMRRAMAITPQKAQASGERLLRALDRLDAALAHGDYLAGDGFSRADLAVAALLAPLVAVGRSEDALARAMPEAVLAWRARESARPCFDWVRTQYRRHR